ncbi:hypothetical protein [Pseudomonas gingeri]|uniref:(S)-ureidoglycine aminohydrolase cupin domain-containing protein n=1 Tax=Pseudomonas gingeri TaxID=117681 RepID=A0A7Y8CK61_9PSED|nr:hypothetical protein [Pseudomonas gingeri]NVZ29582.1 hypothetical protein [Pseudomonas gingeri]NWA08573.1 hypothetical protein [Pseudomonas gingeri]NWB25516.1 hypothetical protein [Pseudomonas gingeri]NWC33230.1 hypothetical protein [Pseudomonas gingeri]NWD08301.1 hypothetical protein [Pseudomonas gingeri]
MSKIVQRQATSDEKAQCLGWELWESGEVDQFVYRYDQDVQFVVQDGKAIIYSQFNEPVPIGPGCHVTIRKGVDGVWEISSPIVNRYKYL